MESPGSVSTMSAAARAASVEPFKNTEKWLKKATKVRRDVEIKRMREICVGFQRLSKGIVCPQEM